MLVGLCCIFLYRCSGKSVCSYMFRCILCNSVHLLYHVLPFGRNIDRIVINRHLRYIIITARSRRVVIGVWYSTSTCLCVCVCVERPGMIIVWCGTRASSVDWSTSICQQPTYGYRMPHCTTSLITILFIFQLCIIPNMLLSSVVQRKLLKLFFFVKTDLDLFPGRTV